MAAPTTKTRLLRAPLLKDLKARLKVMDAEVAAWNKANDQYDKQSGDYKKACNAYEKKVTAYVRKNSKSKNEAWLQYGNIYNLSLSVPMAEVEAALGKAPEWEDFVTMRPPRPDCLDTVEVKRGIYFTQHQLVKEAVYNLEHSDDEHVYQNTYSHVIQFVV